MTSNLEQLIHAFQSKVVEAESIMKEHFGINEPRLFNKNNIPRTGNINNHRYTFHGKGCCFHFRKVNVDYDYGAQGRIDGFDLWRLSRFGIQLKQFVEYIKNEEVKTDFENSVAKGEIILSGIENDNLYYLAEII